MGYTATRYELAVPDPLTKCPSCGCPVKESRLLTHRERVHPRELSPEERAQLERIHPPRSPETARAPAPGRAPPLGREDEGLGAIPPDLFQAVERGEIRGPSDLLRHPAGRAFAIGKLQDIAPDDPGAERFALDVALEASDLPGAGRVDRPGADPGGAPCGLALSRRGHVSRGRGSLPGGAPCPGGPCTDERAEPGTEPPRDPWACPLRPRPLPRGGRGISPRLRPVPGPAGRGRTAPRCLEALRGAGGRRGALEGARTQLPGRCRPPGGLGPWANRAGARTGG